MFDQSETASLGPTKLEQQSKTVHEVKKAINIGFINLLCLTELTSVEVSVPQEDDAVESSEHPAHRDHIKQTHYY